MKSIVWKRTDFLRHVIGEEAEWGTRITFTSCGRLLVVAYCQPW